MSKKFTPFSNKDEKLVIQFTVKHEQNIDCGGGYVKVFDCKLEQKDMHGETPYEIMFGKNSLIIRKAEPKSHWSNHYVDGKCYRNSESNSLTYALVYHCGIPVTKKRYSFVFSILLLIYMHRFIHLFFITV